MSYLGGVLGGDWSLHRRIKLYVYVNPLTKSLGKELRFLGDTLTPFCEFYFACLSLPLPRLESF